MSKTFKILSEDMAFKIRLGKTKLHVLQVQVLSKHV